MARSGARTRPTYRCSECGHTPPRWVGRCPECQAWGSVAETAAPGMRQAATGPVTAPAVPIGQVSAESTRRRTSGEPELDRVLGGGLVPGAAILLAGEPGVGKSTLLLEVAAQTARRARVLYVTGEESASQVRLRADRTGSVCEELYLAAETDLGAVLSHVEQVQPELLVIDSVQTLGAAGVDGVPGGVTQVKEVAAALVRVAKTHGIATVLVGHVTKDGTIAGPRVLEHLVDVVLHFEGERNTRFRMLRAMKNRFGPVDEVGCFDLGADGITAVTDPTGLFVETHEQQVAGTCVAVTMEGRRPLLAEVQALVTPSALERPRRTTSGLDSSRVAMVLAVLQQHCGIRLHAWDVFASTVGGARLHEPAVDLAVAVAIASAFHKIPPPRSVVAMGEIGLAGELRRVRDLPQRVAEAGRLGFATAAVPGRSGPVTTTGEDIRVLSVDTVPAALRLLGLAH
jgi:DNA repair protein RadA/Sms